VLSVVLTTIVQCKMCIFRSGGWYLSNVGQCCTQDSEIHVLSVAYTKFEYNSNFTNEVRIWKKTNLTSLVIMAVFHADCRLCSYPAVQSGNVDMNKKPVSYMTHSSVVVFSVQFSSILSGPQRIGKRLSNPEYFVAGAQTGFVASFAESPIDLVRLSCCECRWCISCNEKLPFGYSIQHVALTIVQA